jgi:hypothetical protein
MMNLREIAADMIMISFTITKELHRTQADADSLRQCIKDAQNAKDVNEFKRHLAKIGRHAHTISELVGNSHAKMDYQEPLRSLI